jgi:uncharacterized protein
MASTQQFIESINSGYNTKGDFIVLGSALLNGVPQKEALVKLPVKTLNRHGLIAGATGTGKTVTLQVIAENMCAKGIPVLLMDLKGDLSGIAKPGIANLKIEERHNQIGIPFVPNATSIEFLTLSNEPGTKLRATVSEFGPVLFSKMLDLNDVQRGIVSIIFKYADDHGLPLLDLKDFKSLLNYVTNEGKEEIKKQYGAISTSSTGTILRSIIELESQGAEQFFGERSFDVMDLCRLDSYGRGIASIIRLNDLQDKPKLFSTFMLCLLAEVYQIFPEAGDLDKPKLCIFIDEAHLIFKNASRDVLDQLEAIIKLIRSKGVGIYFCTQNPYDIPDAILSQLGLKVQHALRAFTEKDRKSIKKTAENYPISEFYKTDELLTSIGIGQALITSLNEKGIPTPLAATHLRAPMSRIGILSESEINEIISKSFIITKYNEVIDRESAHEILQSKILNAQDNSESKHTEKEIAKKTKEEKTTLEKLSENTMVRQVGRTVMREVARGLLGVLGIGGSRSKKKGWF